ncbi:cytidylyltransferase domain-containing protein [Candidatus Omnitrophota bacterium]
MVKKGKKRVVVIIQARMNSERLPGKVMLDLSGKTTLSRVIERVKNSKNIDGICVATSSSKADDVIEKEAIKNEVQVFRGKLDDVLDRYCKAAEMMKADYVIRVTGDNPLTEPRFIDICAKEITGKDLDYVTIEETPYGSGAEAISRNALVSAFEKADKEEKEHVTMHVYRRPASYRICIIKPDQKLRRPDMRLTLDTLNDYVLLSRIFSHFSKKPSRNIKLESVIAFIDGINGGKK